MMNTDNVLTGHGLLLPSILGVNGSSKVLTGCYAKYLGVTYEHFVGLGKHLPQPLQNAHGKVVNMLRNALNRDAKGVRACFASPTIGTPIHCLDLSETLTDFRPRIAKAIAEVTPHLLLEMHLRGIFAENEALSWPTAPALSSLTLGATLTPPQGTTHLRFSDKDIVALNTEEKVLGTFRVAQDPVGFVVERTYFPVGGVTRFATVDHNPVAEFEAHPDKAGNHIDLGGKSVQEWKTVLDEAFALIEKYTPDIFAEMKFLLREVVPVGYDDHKHLSASYREAIGTIYLTLHPNIMTMAEALIHEFQHNKLNLAAYHMDFLENAFHPRYPSPVRPDPRPLWGILLAVHAFIPVSMLYRNMRAQKHPWSERADFERRLGDIDLKNHEGMNMLLAHGKWTSQGDALKDELNTLDLAHMRERESKGLQTQPKEVHLG